eukprot:CAMPEP_0117664690 /NCGR_PEP_ID=MMETSP0804-20121206/9368_1 /TAXON_ID=1074897 /ORGANISM="Tetraselmis astigmatica, Strain CCMP880" /LENGTH=955 /DNA_ID=CAMNT_0005471967 /DNA_START=71 /DNA_END=2938 /DNA_ORIENTATION=+
MTMRGLKVFIADIRNCKNREEEEQRVDKELANIRSKFKSDKSLTEYDKKKYVWKLLYIHMLGYDVEFGHVQAIDLISAPKYTEKQVGYMVTSVLVNENNDFLRLSINAVRNDIVSRNEAFQCLGLSFAANVAGPEFSEALASDTMKLLVANTSRPIVKKKAALCLLRLYRKNPDIISADLWATKMATLLDERDLSVLGTCIILLTAVAARDPTGYETCVPKLVSALDRIARIRTVPQDHTYYGIPSPWSQVRLMRCLQYFQAPTDPQLLRTLLSVVKSILTGTEVVKNVNKNNASHAVLFEALALVIHLGNEPELVKQCMTLLGKFISVKEPNIRYLGLENMCHLSLLPECVSTIRGHLKTIITNLKDPDISIRRRALDLLFTVCDQNTAKDIVSELLEYLAHADFSMREELALKIAILAEKFAPDLLWYVDVSMGLVETAGEYISEDVWFRIVQLVTNHPDMQEHAVRHMHEALIRGATAEPLIQTAAYILGEFSRLVPDMQPMEIYQLLVDKLPLVGPKTKGIILSAFAKLALHSNDEQAKQAIKGTFQKYKAFMDAELQQRAVEYGALSDMTNMRETVLGQMPAYPDRESSLLRRLADATGTPTDETSAASYESMAPIETMAVPSSNGVTDLIGGLDLDDAPPREAAPAAAPAAPVDPLGELMALNDPLPAATTAAGASSDDPFGGGGLSDLIGGGAAVQDGHPITPLADPRMWFKKLTAAPQGVLYEDDYLQIGLKQEYRPPEGRLTLFLGNKSSQFQLDSFQLHVAPSAKFRAQLTSPAPQSLPAKTQQQVVVMVGASGPALEPPTLSLRYHLGAQQVNQSLPLPTVNCKFMTPIQGMASGDFFAAWQAIAGPPMKLQEVVARPHPMPPSQVAAFLPSLNFGVLPGLDPNTNNVVAAASYAIPGGFNPLCMCRIEVEPNSKQQLRVTVATGDPTLSSTLKELIKQQILAM